MLRRCLPSDTIRYPDRRSRKTTADAAPAKATRTQCSGCADRKQYRYRRCFRLWTKLSSTFCRRQLCENSALLVRAKCMTQCCYENYILISRIDNQCADLPRVLQPNVVPRFTPIDRFKHSHAVGRVAADCCF